MYIILFHNVLSKFVIFVRKTEWFLSDQYFPVLRQNDHNDHKRPHILLAGVLKSVVKAPVIFEEAVATS